MSSLYPDPEDVGKIFVGGLSPATTKESLCDYFSSFGEVVDSVVMKNNETGKSRGFGFVTFQDPNCVFKVLQVNNHELDDKKIDPKECTPRSLQKIRKQPGKCKVFLGGLPPNITEEAIRSGMSKFGKVDEVVIMYDHHTKKCRGFGFLSFELEESIEQACAEHYVIINGKQVECKKAEPRMNPKSLTQIFDSPKNRNGYMKQLQFGQIASTQQNNWNSSPNTLFSLQSSPYPGYATYTTTPALSPPNSSASPGYTAVQQLSYMQPYPAIYGTPVANYNYTSLPANAFSPSNFTNSQAVGGQNVTLNETVKSYVLNDYSPNQSSYGPLKTVGDGGNADATYSTQTAISASNYNRFHPYKI